MTAISVGGSDSAGTVVSSRMRWVQLLLWFLAMAIVGTWQYAFTLFVAPIRVAQGWADTTIVWAFTTLVSAEAISALATGYFLDKLQPKKMLRVGGVCLAVGAGINATASSPWMLYLGSAVMAIGVGIVSIGAPISSVKWFPNSKGLATGTVVVGFVAGSLITVLPLKVWIENLGYVSAFLYVGIGQGVVLYLFSFVARSPREGEVPKSEEARVLTTDRDFTLAEALRTGPFWVLFVIFICVCSGGLIVTALFSQIARSYGVFSLEMAMVGLTMTVFSWALFFDRCMNAACRPVFGLLSDRIGRENALALAFAFEAASIYLFLHVAHDPVWFILVSGLIFFGWGEIFTLMPIMIAETYGTKHAQTIYGWLYTAKGFASLSVPFATAYVATAKNWDGVFLLCVIADMVAVAMVLFMLKPMRRKYVSR